MYSIMSREEKIFSQVIPLLNYSKTKEIGSIVNSSG